MRTHIGVAPNPLRKVALLTTGLLVSILLTAASASVASNKNDAVADHIRGAERVAKSFLASIDSGNVVGAEKLVYEHERTERMSGRVHRYPAVPCHSRIEFRERYGKVKSRTLTKTEVVKSFTGFPDGLFVRLTYSVKFEKRGDPVTETVTVKADNPQRWKVVSF